MYADNTSVAYGDFEQFLSEFIESNADKPVLLSLNEGDENILYRDEMRIMEIFNGLSDRYDNVYIK